MDLEQIRTRLVTARPQVAAELSRPHAEEALLAGVVTDLAGRLDLLGEALGVPGEVERALLWGADATTGAEDLRLAAAVRAAGTGTDAEPDLVLLSSTAVAVVDAAIDRPGHAAARAARGEPVPDVRLAEALARHGVVVDGLRESFAPARLAAVALGLAAETDRQPFALALAGRVHDLLRPGRDSLAAWTAAAAPVATAAPQLTMRAVSWLHVANALVPYPGAAAAVRRIHTFPPLAATRSQLT